MMLKKRKWNTGKKLAAVLLSGAVAASSCPAVFAQEEAAAETGTKCYKLENLSLTYNDQVFDLTGLSAEVDIAKGDGSGGVCLHLDADGQTVAEVGFTTVDDLYVYHLESPSLGSKDYVIDPTAALANSLEQGIDMLVGVLQNVNTDQLAETIMKISKAKPEETEAETEAPETEAAPAETEAAAEISVQGDIASLINSCITSSQNVELSGTVQGASGEALAIADGTYNTKTLSMDTDKLTQMLDMIYVNGESSGASEELKKAGAEALFELNLIEGTSDDLNKIVSMNLSFSSGEEQNIAVVLDVNRSASEYGQTADAIFRETTGGNTAGLGFRMYKGDHEGTAFDASTVDLENAVMLNEMDEEAADSEVGSAISALTIDLVSAVIGPVMSGMLANIDFSALEAATEAAPAE